jgi:hypothetical protein
MTRSRATLALATLAVATLLVAGPAAAQEPMITVEPSADLADGDTLTVTVAGFPASSETFVSGQCVTPIEDPLQQCDVATIVPVALDANGGATFEITVKVGPIGTGNCGPDADDCVIMVGSLAEPENAAAPISFAGQDGDGTPQPTAVNTGDGLSPSGNSAALLAAAAGLLLVGGGAMALRRRFVDS